MSSIMPTSFSINNHMLQRFNPGKKTATTVEKTSSQKRKIEKDIKTMPENSLSQPNGKRYRTPIKEVEYLSEEAFLAAKRSLAKLNIKTQSEELAALYTDLNYKNDERAVDYLLTAEFFTEKKDFKMAMKYIEAAFRSLPSDNVKAQLYLQKAIIHEKQNHLEDALNAVNSGLIFKSTFWHSSRLIDLREKIRTSSLDVSKPLRQENFPLEVFSEKSFPKPLPAPAYDPSLAVYSHSCPAEPAPKPAPKGIDYSHYVAALNILNLNPQNNL